MNTTLKSRIWAQGATDQIGHRAYLAALLPHVKGAGLVYICNPNNPTGTVTKKADIDYIVAHKPEGCVVLLDEEIGRAHV